MNYSRAEKQAVLAELGGRRDEVTTGALFK